MIIPYASESLDRIAETISSGGVIGFRTDTFYGLGADPFNREAVRRIVRIKGREGHKPILLVIAELSEVERFISAPSSAFRLLADKFWPGALTLIGEARSEVPVEISAGSKTVGIRLPADDKVRALLTACGGALTATSANLSEKPPARSAREVDDYFGNAIDLIVNDGEAQTDRPSTVVDACGDDVKLIREGVISWSEIQRVVKP